MKSVQAVTRQFCSRLHDLLKEYWKGGDSRIDLNGTIRGLLEYHISASYFEGIAAGGISPEDFDEDMAQEADSLVFEQYAHVDGFIAAIEEAKADKDKRAGVEQRAELWCQAVEQAGITGLNTANAQELCEFKLVGPDSEESCTTCQRLLGKRHTRKWIKEHDYEVRNGNEKFECGCWNCPHEWVPVKKRKG